MLRDEVAKAFKVIQDGGIILYPTDTIWGIGCDATNTEAVNKIYKLKQRDEDKQRDIASQGGKASSSKQDMSKLGKKGAKAQPTEAKAKGGHNSHKND